jgi:integration host factor subunit alpha
MRKLDIARAIQRATDIPEKEAIKVLDFVLELFKATLKRGEPIKVPGFGNFTVRNKATRLGRNPRTGAQAIIPARRVVTFRPSHVFRVLVN